MKAPITNPLINEWLSRYHRAPRLVASFDSSAAMMLSLARFLRDEDAPASQLPFNLRPGALINELPPKAREAVYSWSGSAEAISSHAIGQVRSEALSRFVVNEYPKRTFPAVMVGSSSGAVVHLAAALGVPWLPQTFLIPVRRTGVHPDEPADAMTWGLDHARAFLDANPDLELHHVHDPNQDRLMVQRMSSFRVKRLRLGIQYERFISERIPRGGTIFVVECSKLWPVTRLESRHVFQFGAVGGATPEELHQGGPRVADFLERYGSHRRHWQPPTPTGWETEAEWGFAEPLRDDIEQLARRRGLRVRRIIFDEPDHLSPFVADLYRWWYALRAIHSKRLLVESYLLLDPRWALRTGSAPLWMTFNSENDAQALEHYLDHSSPFDEIHLTLFSHGVESIGVAPVERWRSLLQRARRQGHFAGVDEACFPRDFGVFARYPGALREILSRYPMPAPLEEAELDHFIAAARNRYAVRWVEQRMTPQPKAA